MSMGKRIKYLREREGLNQTALGKIIGVSDKAVSAWETDKKIPRMGKLQAIADHFGVPKSYIIDGDQFEGTLSGIVPPSGGLTQTTHAHRVPRIGTIACGRPIFAQENIECYDMIPTWIHCDFSLTCKGDSMIGAGIQDGSIVFIKQQEVVEQGQIAAVLIDGEATLKRVRYINGGIALWPENPQYEPMIYMGRQAKAVRILGLATYCISEIK